MLLAAVRRSIDGDSVKAGVEQTDRDCDLRFFSVSQIRVSVATCSVYFTVRSASILQMFLLKKFCIPYEMNSIDNDS